MAPGVEVVAHGDWRVQNLSVRAGLIDAVYDWDSVAVMPTRCTAVAAAALTFTVDWQRVDTRFPGPAETAGFVTEYRRPHGVAVHAATSWITSRRRWLRDGLRRAVRAR